MRRRPTTELDGMAMLALRLAFFAHPHPAGLDVHPGRDALLDAGLIEPHPDNPRGYRLTDAGLRLRPETDRYAPGPHSLGATYVAGYGGLGRSTRDVVTAVLDELADDLIAVRDPEEMLRIIRTRADRIHEAKA
jgi:hypothetical protein